MSWDRRADAGSEERPVYVVWELTLSCDHACLHCGSRAGKARPDELTVAECLPIVEQLAALGTEEVTFIGGEAYLAPGWLEVVRATVDAGIRATLTTGGRGLTRERARQAREAGLSSVNVSIDGLAAAHDRLRNLRGSHAAALRALDAALAEGLTICANTQINRVNQPDLETLADLLFDHGVRAWQVQLTGPMGRGADAIDWLLQPHQLLEVVPTLAGIAERLGPRGFSVQAANNLGYFGPYEHLLRRAPWAGCMAGRYVLGIESNGDMKGCPSLPSGPYVGGNLREAGVAELWQSKQLRFTRDRDASELWGFCATCYYGPDCRAGCSWTAHTLLGRRGNMPYCFHRVETLAASGRRERVVHVEPAPGEPFDFGRFELVEEEV